MAIYTISDLHLSLGMDKPMDIFGEIWEKHEEKIKETYRYEYFAMRGGAWLDAEADDGAVVTHITDEKLYNYYTGEEYISVEDVFYEDSGYEFFIEEFNKEEEENVL